MATIPNRNTFKKNFSWNFLGEVIYSATQWGIIVVITRLGSVEMAGLYSLALAVTAPIMMFTNLELRTIQATDIKENNNISNYGSLRLLSNIFFLAILFITMYIIDYSLETYLIIILIAIAKIIESWSDLIHGFFHMKETMEFISISKIIRGSFSLFTVFITMLFTESLGYTIGSLIIVWLLNFLFYDLRTLRRFDLNFNIHFSKNIIDIIKLAFPLGIVAMIVSLNANLPRLIIENYLNLEMLGYFATIFYFIMIGTKFVNSVFQTALPRLSTYYVEGDITKFKSLLLKMNILAVVTGITGILIAYLWGEYILIFIYGDQFQDSEIILVLIMIYGMFMYFCGSLTLALNSIKYFKIQPYLSLIWLVTILASSLYYIPKYGLSGAGIALIIYSVIRTLSIFIVLSYGLRKEFNIQ